MKFIECVGNILKFWLKEFFGAGTECSTIETFHDTCFHRLSVTAVVVNEIIFIGWFSIYSVKQYIIFTDEQYI